MVSFILCPSSSLVIGLGFSYTIPFGELELFGGVLLLVIICSIIFRSAEDIRGGWVIKYAAILSFGAVLEAGSKRKSAPLWRVKPQYFVHIL